MKKWQCIAGIHPANAQKNAKKVKGSKETPKVGTLQYFNKNNQEVT